ncbi:DUF5357 family protein [Allocoleopsis sp.]|uniref:DUF5357 family protein n=1 Tax=Allocoleopsis sp. TaxID=3088169 RepID=UPI002FD1EF68
MKFLLGLYTWLRKEVRLPSAFSWETLIVLSLFSYYMTILATGWVRNFVVNFGWIFLILGVFWGTTASNQLRIGYKTPAQPGFPLSPWITGALVSIYIFGFVAEGESRQLSRNMLIYWPIISAIIALIPDYVGVGLKVKVPPPEKRKNQFLLVTSQILLSCWFQFHFLIQDYTAQYPSLLVDDFRKSAFVVKWEAPLSAATPRGAAILDGMGIQLRDSLDSKRWSDVERLLLPKELNKLISTNEKQVKKRLPPTLEDDLWQVSVAGGKASARGSGGYNLPLQAIWQGPRAKTETYSVTKTCQILPVDRLANAATKPLNTPQDTPSTSFSRFECQEVKGWGLDRLKKRLDSFTRT